MARVVGRIWWFLILTALIVFAVGMAIGLSGHYLTGIVILIGDLIFVQVLKPGRHFQ